MKRPLSLFCFLVFLFFSFSVASAQDFDFNRALQDYLYNYNLYRSAHIGYVSAKSEYLTYKTLSAQTRALEATRKMLDSRAQALKTYLTALRMKLKETTGVTNYQQNLQYLKLDNEVTWLNLHQEALPSPGTIEDLIKISSELEKRYSSIEVLSYQTLGTILGGKENDLREKINDQVSKTENKIEEIKAAGEDVSLLERWLIEIKQKITRSEEKQREAEQILISMKSNERDKKKIFDKAQLTFEESNQYLKEAVSNLYEIIREIKRE